MRALLLPDLDAHLCYHDLPGREPTCVYLHGLGAAASADFPPVVRDPRLTPYRALLVDLLGFGFSDRPAAFPHTLEAHAGVVARVLDQLAVRGCRVIGHSMGGGIAIALAAARPDLVSGLVVAEPCLDAEDATLSRIVADQAEAEYVTTGHAAFIARVEAWAADDPSWADYPGTLRAADPRAMHRCARAVATCSLRETFFGLAMPRTYVFGARTLPHRHEALLRTAGGPTAVVADAGHAMTVENPPGFAGVGRPPGG